VLLSIGRSYAKENFSLEKVFAQTKTVDTSLTSIEWRKFKKFEQTLQSAQMSENDKEEQLTDYARDSLRILEVKLVAIRVLEEKKLLNRDIAENPSYYSGLLEELKASNIPPLEYLFLEEKLAYINQEAVTEKLKWSRWLNVGLVTLVVILGFTIFWKRKNQDNNILPELSKQETLVRNLILQGKSNKEIATELFISLSTVKTHITNIYSKMNVANRRELLENSTGAST
tara:strand:+ start:1744 stop:2430 length:687 start_codon:yes stop_codon:yes gene_type:complete